MGDAVLDVSISVYGVSPAKALEIRNAVLSKIGPEIDITFSSDERAETTAQD